MKWSIRLNRMLFFCQYIRQLYYVKFDFGVQKSSPNSVSGEKKEINLQFYHLNLIQTFTMQFLICSKHSKTQKAAHKVTTNSYICMNRYCQQSFLTLCNVCKNDHRDHSNKILTLEDITFLIERLLKSPFKQLTSYIDEAVGAMKKFKLIQENKRKIELLEKEIYKEVMGLVDFTESLIHEYALCKKKITDLSDMLANVETPSVFEEFTKNSTIFLSNLEYNFQKDKFQYGNQIIRQKFENRRKSFEKTKRKLQQVKDYSMKIIEVILANEDSEQEEEDIIYKKKMYEILKRELLETSFGMGGSDKEIMGKEGQQLGNGSHNGQQSREEKEGSESNPNNNATNNQSSQSPSQNGTTSYSMISYQDKISKSTATPGLLSSKSPSSVLSIQKSCQTSPQWLLSIESTTTNFQQRIKKLQQTHAKSLNELQNKISMLVKQKDVARKEYSILEQRQKQKNEKILEIEMKLRENKLKREQKEKERQQKMEKLIDVAGWRVVLEGDRVD